MNDHAFPIRPAHRRRVAFMLRAASALACLGSVLVATPVLAQHPRDVAAWPDPASTPCTDTAPDARAGCESREAERLADLARVSREYHAWLADRLAGEGGARNLAIAAHLRAMSLSGELFETDANLSSLEGDARIASWVERATREGHDDTLVHMLLNRRFSTTDQPRLAALRARWIRLDPGNLAPRMFDAEDAAGDDDFVAALFRDAERFDVYFVEQMRTAIAAFERHPPDRERAAILLEGDVPTVRSYASTMGLMMVGFPRFIDAIDACRGNALTQTSMRRQHCLHLGRVLADRSDTLIAHVMGLAILVRAAENEDERNAAEARRRLTAWLMEREHVLWQDATVLADDASASSALSSATDEIDFIQAMLQRHGIPLEPPAGWKHAPLQ